MIENLREWDGFFVKYFGKNDYNYVPSAKILNKGGSSAHISIHCTVVSRTMFSQFKIVLSLKKKKPIAIGGTICQLKSSLSKSWNLMKTMKMQNFLCL